MIVAMVNSKGGVGKSTIAVHLAVWWKERGGDVALVDANETFLFKYQQVSCFSKDGPSVP